MEYEIQEIKTADSILSISTTQKSILFGGKSRMLKEYTDTEKILWKHKKSIRFIDARKDLFGCVSYDCTATIFKDGLFFDTIEGPETEIKCLCFSEDNEFLAMSTRGKTVWICKISNEIEVDAIIEDHLHDVKGVKFNQGNLYSFSYDNTIKMYERFDLDESWELIQSLEEDNTVWNVEFYNDLMITCGESGIIRIYEFTGEWVFSRCLEASVYPIYSMAIFQGLICYSLNRDSLSILNMNLKEVFTIEGLGEISCIHSCMYRGVLVCGLSNGSIKIINIKVS